MIFRYKRLSTAVAAMCVIDARFSTAFVPVDIFRPVLSTIIAKTTIEQEETERRRRKQRRRRLDLQRLPLLLSSSDPNDETAPSSSSFSIESNNPISTGDERTTSSETVMKINGASSEEAAFPFTEKQGIFSFSASSTLDRIRKISNLASLLCVLDCTLLPIMTVALPLMGVLNLGSSRLQAIDRLGHSVALYFVLPMGGITSMINYVYHKKRSISLLAVLGLTMVGLANSHIHIHLWPTLFNGSISFDWVGTVLDSIQGCGSSPWHRIVNIAGCALLLSSNYLSQKQDKCSHGCNKTCDT